MAGPTLGAIISKHDKRLNTQINRSDTDVNILIDHQANLIHGSDKVNIYFVLEKTLIIIYWHW